ncbi:hypothetical protein DFS33DRAFT_1491192 [Desarmillaria ectypa]|nr:hypothetical protein DFS33DRAFT_1491192 [Desarmillaria ectypa]
MAQLRMLEFDRIDTLEFPDPDLSYTIGPLHKIEEGKVVHELSPFPTALSYIDELASSLAGKHNEPLSNCYIPPDANRPPLYHIFHIASSPPNDLEFPQYNQLPELDRITWDTLPAELQKVFTAYGSNNIPSVNAVPTRA